VPIEFDPDNAMAWQNRGMSLLEWGRYEKRLQAFDRVIGIQPNHEKAWLNRAIVLEKLRRYPEAIASYKEAAQLQPCDDTIWYNKARCYIMRTISKRQLTTYNEQFFCVQINIYKFLKITPNLIKSVTINAFKLCSKSKIISLLTVDT
jgi:tetratricopeptide (TPR) repeat protein